jgi:hypothetical protein
MMTRPGRTLAVLLVAGAIAAGCSGRPHPAFDAGFWFEPDASVIPDGMRATFRQLSGEEIAAVQRTSRREIEQAFAGLRINVTTDRSAFWRVRVIASIPARRNQALPKAGESIALGMLGGTGTVGFDIVSLDAIRYAPPGINRSAIVEAIGRGVGRVAVHEFVHQMFGADDLHDTLDRDSYEYASPDRASQYYGSLHWTTAWPRLQARFGT